MLPKLVTCCLAMLLATSVAVAAAPPELSSKFESATQTGVPGVVLPAGSFSVQVESHAGNRYIVTVKDQIGDRLATFLGLPEPRLAHGPAGKLIWPSANNGVTYLKGWYFPAASVALEFVYPKTDAVALAQANHEKVAAIDPASDGLLASPGGLSPRDLQMVTLWLLTPTHVGAKGADGIQAARYEQAPPAANTQQVASLRRPALKKLPHTAGQAGWLYLLAAGSMLGAMGLRLRRIVIGIAASQA